MSKPQHGGSKVAHLYTITVSAKAGKPERSAKVVIEVDFDLLAKKLGYAALENKTGKASAAYGAVCARIGAKP